MILSRRGADFDLCGDVRYATALPPNVLQTIFAAQIQEAIDVPFTGPLLEVWTRERASVQLLTRKTEADGGLPT